jgi:hypothetical protein
MTEEMERKDDKEKEKVEEGGRRWKGRINTVIRDRRERKEEIERKDEGKEKIGREGWEYKRRMKYRRDRKEKEERKDEGQEKIGRESWK